MTVRGAGSWTGLQRGDSHDRKDTQVTQEKIENLQYVALALTVAGQVTIGANYFVGQGCYMLANVIAVYRNIKLERPRPDKVRDWALTGLTAGCIIAAAILRGA